MKLLMLLLALTVVFTSPFTAFADEDEGGTTTESSDDMPDEGGGDSEDPEYFF